MTSIYAADGFCNPSFQYCSGSFFNLVSPAEFTNPSPGYDALSIYISLSNEDYWSRIREVPTVDINPTEPFTSIALDAVEIVTNSATDPPVVILQNQADIQFPIRPEFYPDILCRSVSVWWRMSTYSAWLPQGAWGLLDDEYTVVTDDVPVFLAEDIKIKMTSINISEGPLFLSPWVESNATVTPW